MSATDLSLLIDSLPGGVVAVELSGGEVRGLYANARMPGLVGCAPGEYFAGLAARPFGALHPEDAAALARSLARPLPPGRPLIRVCRLLLPGAAEPSWLRLAVSPAGAAGEGGAPRFCVLVSDVSAERTAERERAHAAAALQMRAERDTLTGIYNRLAFCERTAKMLRESPDERFVLIRCNVERFKLLNDLHGRAVGDRVLRRLADTLRSIAGGIWTFGRLEADHFALCLPKPLAFIEVLQRKIAAGLAQENLESPVLVNFGIYEIEDPEMPVEQMCDRANIALQTIKGNYAHRHAYYDAMLRSAMLQEQEIINDMIPAMGRGEFVVHFQPIYGTDSSGRPLVMAAEALVRWQHPRRGLLGPEAFVPLFERNGYIAKLDYFIWEEVCRFQSARQEAKRPTVPVSVNVSRLNLRNPSLSADIKALADRYRVRYTLLPLEITEDAYADGPEQLLKTAGALRQCGFPVYMDDFGSGYSSLNALKDIPCDVIKMDAEFLRGLETSKNGGNIVTAVVRMARTLGKPVVAEGVENEEQVRFLRGIGCERFQGFYFSPALPQAGFAALLDAGARQAGAPAVPGPAPLVSGDIDINAFFEDDSLASRLLDCLIDGIGIYELAGDRLEVVRVNDGFLGLMGCDPKSFYQHEAASLFGRLPEADRECLLNVCKAVAKGVRDDQLLVLRRIRDDDGETLLSARVRYLGVRNGRPLLCLSFNDITAGRNSKEVIAAQQRDMLSRHNQFLERLYRTIPCGIVELRMDGALSLSTANQAACDIFGYADENAFRAGFSATALDWVHPDDRADVEKLIHDFLAAPGRVPYEHRIVRRDGKVAWLKGTIDAVTARDGRPRLQNVFLDVTEEKDEKRTLQLIMDNLPVGVGIFQMGERQEPVYLSGQLWEIFGLDPEGYAELRRAGEGFAFLPPSDTLGLERLRQGAAELPFEQVYRAARRDGAPLWLRVVGQARLDDNGHTVVYASIVDITERIAEERQMTKQDELYKLLMEDSQMLIFDYDPETRLMEYSLMLPDHRRAQRQIAGYVDQLPQSATLHPESRAEFARRMRAAELAPARDTFEYRADYFGKGYAWYRCVYKSLADATGRVFRVVGRSYDVTAEKEQEEALRAKAAHDAMSGLYNRAMTEELINSRLQALAPGEKCFLMIIDIDRFKSINDTLGHPTGDRVIKSIAAVLRAQFRPEDVVGRIGGDEFAVLMRTGAEGRVHERVDAILHAVRDLSKEMALGVAFSSSIGVAEAPRDGRAFDALFPNADRALYQAKQQGKDCGVFFDPATMGAGE